MSSGEQLRRTSCRKFRACGAQPEGSSCIGKVVHDRSSTIRPMPARRPRAVL